MTESAREHLLGYLLGALDDAERDVVEEHLYRDAELRWELALLREGMKPLAATRQDFSAPANLAARTCQFVASHRQQMAAETETAPEQPAAAVIDQAEQSVSVRREMSPEPESPTLIGGWSWKDLAIAAAIIVAASLLIIPAIHSSRAQARMMACQDNLRQLGLALTQYSQHNHDFFPPVPSVGKLAAAGIYAPTLLGSNFLADMRQIICPDSSLADNTEFEIPSLEKLQSTADSRELDRLHRSMGGSYGYCLGHMLHGCYHHTKNLRRKDFAVMADAPSAHLPSYQSANHGGSGQNVLYEDRRVQFVVSPKPNHQADDFFVNDDGLVAAGTHRDDSVIGPSAARPIASASNP